jgi:type I restriction enzyme S subunit
MIADLKPYLEYKESGSRWLETIPQSWDVQPLCRLTRLKSERNRPDLELLSVYLDRGVIRYSDSGGQVHKPSLDLSAYQVVDPGDLVMNNQQAWRGSVGVSRYKGIISPAYVVLSLAEDLSTGYANSLFRSPAMVSQNVVASRGVGDIQRNLYYPDLRRTLVPVPPPAEQAAIVRFLDHWNGRLEKAIRAKRRVIALLQEQKQAIIHRAVTCGLDPKVQLKESGIPWLGEIPAHWEVRRAKYVFHEVDERSKDGTETHLAMSQKLGLVPSDMVKSALRSESYAGGKLCKPGDLVLNRLKAHLGVFAIAGQLGVISPDYSVFRKIAEIDVEYFEAVLKSSACRRELRIRAKGLVEGFWRLYTDDFYDIRLPLPPVAEQKAIMTAVSEETLTLSTAIARYEREITLLREYRTRLTADVVTGKLDVRAAAAQLPEPAQDTAPAEAEVLGEEPELEEVE